MQALCQCIIGDRIDLFKDLMKSSEINFKSMIMSDSETAKLLSYNHPWSVAVRKQSLDAIKFMVEECEIDVNLKDTVS